MLGLVDDAHPALAELAHEKVLAREGLIPSRPDSGGCEFEPTSAERLAPARS